MANVILGTVLLIITVFVHKHTYNHDFGYDRDTHVYGRVIGDRLPFPRWLLLIMIVLAYVPFVNAIVFCIGAGSYICIHLLERDIIFYCKSKKLDFIKEFLCKEV